MKTYEIKKQPIVINNETIVKYNIYYYNNNELDGPPEFYSYENQEPIHDIRPGYTKVIDLNSVSSYKDFLIKVIDEHTTELISAGFTFDNNLFSMSANAQINWSNMPNIPSSFFPLRLSTKDDNVYLLSWENKENFYLTAMGFKHAKLEEGTELIQQVKSCTTIEELEFIMNNL